MFKRQRVAAARPTAVNLFWAVERMIGLAKSDPDPQRMPDRLLAEAQRMYQEVEEINRKMGSMGLDLMHDGGAVLPSRNTGA